MCLQEIITALGRFKSQKQIGLRIKDLNKVFEWKRPFSVPDKLAIEKLPLLNAIIYEIVGEDGKVYRGKTTSTIEKRQQEHLDNHSSKIIGEWMKGTVTKFRELMSFSYLHHDEVLTIEKEFIEQIPYDKSMNTQHKSLPPPSESQHFKLVVQSDKPKKLTKRPTITDRSKHGHKDYKLLIKGESIYFKFKVNDASSKANALAEANAYLNDQGY